MKFLRSKSKLFCVIASLIVNFNFGIITAEANANNYSNNKNHQSVNNQHVNNRQYANNHYNRHNNQPKNDNSVYIGYGYIAPQNPYYSAIYSNYGIDISVDEHNKIKLEGSSGNIYLNNHNYTEGLGYFAIGLEHEHQGYVTEVSVSSFNSSKITSNTIQTKLGHKDELTDSIYAKSKISLGLTQDKIHYGDTSNNLFVAPEVTVGTNFDMSNSIISLNPELSFRYIINANKKHQTVASANVNCDIGMFFVKIAHNVLEEEAITNISSFTFGVKF